MKPIIRVGAAIRRLMGTYAMVVEVTRPLSSTDSVCWQSFRDSLSSDDAKSPKRYAHALHSIVLPSVGNEICFYGILVKISFHFVRIEKRREHTRVMKNFVHSLYDGMCL